MSLFFSGCTLTNLSANGSKNQKITILDQRSLTYPVRQGIPFAEISDIAYNPQTKKLYMIGDKGYFYTFDAVFSNKIKQLRYNQAFTIKNSKPLDIEGLTMDGNHQLIASFEQTPRILKISPKGLLRAPYTLPKKLQNNRAYQGRNKMLEAVAYHPKYGILTAAEYPLNKQNKQHQTIYDLHGKEWHFEMEPYPNSAITAMTVTDDQNLLVIERSYQGLSKPFVITLKKIYLNQCNKQHHCKDEVLATFNSAKGGGYNNFEGLTKVGKNRYVMVSDNNNLALLPTTLLYFKVNP